MSWLWNWLWVPVAIYLLFGATLFVFQRALIYRPADERPEPAMAGAPAPEVVSVQTPDGLMLSHWYWPPAKPGAPVLAVFHGNAGHIGHRAGKYRFALEAGCGLLLVEYRGYGGNPGTPSEPALTADSEALLGWLKGRGVAPGRTILYGESLGTGLAVKLAAAAAEPFRGVILEAPYTSIAAVAQAHHWYLPALWLVRDRWDAAAAIAAIRAPLLVLHGERDSVVPARFGRALYQVAAEPKSALWLPAAGHNDVLDFPEARAQIEDLLRR